MTAPLPETRKTPSASSAVCGGASAVCAALARPCRRRRRRRQQQIEQSLVDALVREVFDLRLALAAHHVDRALDEVAHHRLDVASDVADFGELRRLDLDERRAGELGEATGDLRLPHARRADEDDVVRRDLLANRFGRALAAPAVAQRDRDRLLRVGLPDDVAIELRRDLTRRQIGELARAC